MAEYSFPAMEKPISDQEWKSVTLGIGDGIFDEGGNPYSLKARSNINDTVTIGVDSVRGYSHAILKGFYHKLDTDTTVRIPPVTAPTTYYIVLCYDPLNQDKPVSLKAVTALDRTSGKEYIILWTVRRNPNQLLTDAVVNKYRQAVTPAIQVDYAENLPDATTVLFGTRAHCLYTGEQYRASFSEWKQVSARIASPLVMGGWGYGNGGTRGIAVVPASGGFFCTWAGGLGREAEGFNIPNTWTGRGAIAGTAIPNNLRPAADVYGIGTSDSHLLELRLDSSGRFAMRNMGSSSAPLARGAGISFNFSWFVAEPPSVRA